MLAVALILPLVNMLPPELMNPEAEILPEPGPPKIVKFPPVMLPVALSVVATTFAPFTLPAVEMLPPVMLPLTDNRPVMYSPVVAKTATLLVPPTPTAMLPPELTTVTFELPLLILATDVITPVRLAPLPSI